MRNVIQILLTFTLNALWQGTLIVAFAAFCDWLLTGVAARYRHYLWVTTLFACLIVPALSCVGLRKSAQAPSVGPLPAAATATVTSRIITPGIEDVSSSSPDGPQAPQRFSLLVPVRVPLWLAFTIAGLYLLVVLWRLGALLSAWRRTRHIVAGVFECTFPEWICDLIARCQAESGVKTCRVLCSPEAPVPITVGVFDRIIILPKRFASEINVELFTSALGHELQHIARHDYLLNLIYEFAYVPLAFHPAAAFVRRRIRHTRELCCDAAVINRLISPEAYARSLVKLIGSAPLLPLAPDTTIGMNESDILEVRIMSLFNRSKLSARRRVSLLGAAAFLLAMPCVAAARLALKFDTSRQSPAIVSESQQVTQTDDRRQREKTLVELESQAQNLKQRLEQTPAGQKPEVEARLREVERNLELHRRALEQFNANRPEVLRLRQALDEFEESRPRDEAKLKEAQQLLAQVENSFPNDEALRELKQRLAQDQTVKQLDRKVRVLERTEPEYPADAREKKIEGSVVVRFVVDHDGHAQDIVIKKSLYPSLDEAAIKAVRGWRFEPAFKDGQPVSMWLEAEVVFRLDAGAQSQEERETRERREKEQAGKATDYRFLLNDETKRRAEREAEQKRSTMLAAAAKISMDHAIQIATSVSPGKVIECSLVGERWEGNGELAKPAFVLYHVVVLSEESNPVKTHVLINAIDGSVFRVNKEEKREEEQTTGAAARRRAIEGGVLNGKAASLPAPEYPAIARAAHAGGEVTVRIVIDEGGNVVEVATVSGHPLLRAAAVAAAREAKFNPTRLKGEPVVVTGLLVYNFVEQ
jgi:bla regulator protein blaR1